MAQRKLDVVLDSVKRLHAHGRDGEPRQPAPEAASRRPRAAVLRAAATRIGSRAFSLLVERNSRLAMEALSELGPEAGAALLAGRSAEEIGKLLQELPSDDAAAIIDYLPEELSAAVLELMQKRPAGGDVGELLEYEEQTAGRIMNPKVFALSEDMTAGEAITALQGSRDVEMVFYLYVIDARRHLVGVVSLRRLLLVPPSTPLKRIMTTDLISVARRHGPGRGRAAGRVLQPARHSGRRRGEQAGRRDHRRRRHRRHQGRGDRGRLPAGRRDRRRPRVHARRSSRCASGCRGCRSISATAFLAASVVALFEGTISDGHRARGLHAGRRRHGRQRRDADADGHRPRHRARRADVGQHAARRCSRKRLVGHRQRRRPAGSSAALVVWVLKGRSGARR